MELLMELGIGVLVIVLLVGALAVWRISRVVSWRALAMIARATGSFEECVAFIRFCARHGSESRTKSRPEARGISSLRGWAHALDDIRRASR